MAFDPDNLKVYLMPYANIPEGHFSRIANSADVVNAKVATEDEIHKAAALDGREFAERRQATLARLMKSEVKVIPVNEQ